MPETTETMESETGTKKERRLLFGVGDMSEGSTSLYIRRDGTYTPASNPNKGSILTPFVEMAKNARNDLELRTENEVVPVTVSKRSKYIYVAMWRPHSKRKMVRTEKLSDSDYASLESEWNNSF
jgi:hypothetical protein